MWNWLLHLFGIDPRTPSTAYNWWSGAGSDLGELAIIGGLMGMARKVNCHEPRCFRIGHHTTADGHKLCHKHIQQPLSELNLVEVHEDHIPI